MTNRHIFGVYIAPVLQDTDVRLTPIERQKEVESVTDRSLKMQKISTWLLLEKAVKHAFSYDFCELEFTKQKNGKWVSDKVFLSISHTDGYAVVALSDLPVGVDIENISSFEMRWKDEKLRRAFAKKIGADEDTPVDGLLKLWLEKESVYKLGGEGTFNPKNIDTLNADGIFFDYLGNKIFACGKNVGVAEFFEVNNGVITPVK